MLHNVISELVDEKGLKKSDLNEIIKEGILAAYLKKYPEAILRIDFDKAGAVIVEIEKILSLRECLTLYDKKFKSLKQNKTHILKSLNYFYDADKEANLKMIKSVQWKEVKSFFQQEIKEISNEIFYIK